MANLNPYLLFNGNTEEVFNFYRSVFGGEFPMILRHKDMPPGNEMPGSKDEDIMHIALPIGKRSVLMGNDVPEVTIGNNFNISVDTESEEEANKLFSGLSAGGKVTMPLGKTFWSACFGMCTDKFGIQWIVDYNENQEK